MSLLKNNKILIFIIIASIAVRLFLAFNFEGTGDSGGWRLIGKTGLHGGQHGVGNGTVYDGDCPLLCGNWTPFTYHTYIVLRWVYENLNPFNFPQWGFYKLLPVISIIPIAYIIFRLSRFYKVTNPVFLVFLYAFHPVSLYVSAYHGQREALWLCLLLAAVMLYKFKHFFWFSIIFAIAVSVKIPPLLFAPLLLLKLPSMRDRVFFLISLILIFFILNLPEIVTHTENVIKQVFFYPGIGGWWGISGLAAKLDLIFLTSYYSDTIKPINKIVLYGFVIIGSLFFYYKKRELLESIMGIMMIIFVMTPVFASQYLLWPLPFIILLYKKHKRYFLIYSLLATVAAMGSYSIYGISLLEQIILVIPRDYIFNRIPYFSYPGDLYFPLWIFSVFYLIKIVKRK